MFPRMIARVRRQTLPGKSPHGQFTTCRVIKLCQARHVFVLVTTFFTFSVSMLFLQRRMPTTANLAVICIEHSHTPPSFPITRQKRSAILKNDLYFDGILNSDNTSLLAQGPYEVMLSFLKQHPNTAGSRFILFLLAELHGHPEWEPHRQSHCDRCLPLCIGGYHNMQSRSVSSTPRFSTSFDRLVNFYNTREHDTFLPLLPQTNATSVYCVRRYRDTDHCLLNLGTNKACLPLMLAASSIDPNTGMVLELGPFTGFSSKCLAYGVVAAINGTANVEHSTAMSILTRLISFDTFEGTVNFASISKKAKWVLQLYPTYSKGYSNFESLWQDTVQYIYAPAKAISGYINASTVNDEEIQKYNINISINVSTQVLIVDTVKNSKLLHQHLEGLIIHVGTVLFLMDFQRSKDLVQQIYGCFRTPYLLPVYISWNNEHMAFVVTKTFHVNDRAIFQCYQELAAVDFNKTVYHTYVMKAQLKQDLMFLSGLTTDKDVHKRYEVGLRDKTLQALNGALDEQNEWTWRVLSGLGDRK